jgi:cardiolipin synthase
MSATADRTGLEQERVLAATTLFHDGIAAFDRIVQRIEAARRTIAVRAFVWRDDATGNMMGRALLAAANRGVRISIRKDLVGATYEHSSGSKQSFFHKTLDVGTRMQAWLFATAYGSSCQRIPQRQNTLADDLLRHPNITVQCDRKLFDHTKIYVIDDEVLFAGGMGIGDNARFETLDFMLEAHGEEHVARYRDRCTGRVPFDPSRTLDFLVHTPGTNERHDDRLIHHRLRFLQKAEQTVSIEMAYLGDPRITRALIAVVDRGVSLTLITSARSDIIADLNLATCDEILRRTGAPEHLRIVLHPGMIHSKIIVIDGRIVDVGSANFTLLSHETYHELDAYVQDPRFGHAVEAVLAAHVRQSRRVTPRASFNRVRAFAERTAVRYHVRTAKKEREPFQASVRTDASRIGADFTKEDRRQ